MINNQVIRIGKLENVPYSRYLKFQSSLRKFRKENILFLSHSPTITAGINYNIENLHLTEVELRKKGIELHYIKRGGDFTLHNPGQLIIYFHIDLKKRNLSISQFLGLIQKNLIQTIEKIWGLVLVYNKDKPGLYIPQSSKKIVSIGVYFKSFFTSFGISFNISNRLGDFYYISPCGQNPNIMTSIQELGLKTELEIEFIDSFYHQFINSIFPR